jgi:hypothetical protein
VPDTDRPEAALAAALARGLNERFEAREATASALAELLLDATEDVLPLLEGQPAQPALDALEMLATSLDLYAWDGPPGWDEVLARGLHARAPLEPGPSPLDGLGDAPDRAAQLERADARARSEAALLVSLGKQAARAQGAREAASLVVALHSSLCRLVALAAAAAPLRLPEDPASGDLPPPGEQSLIAELDERARSGSDFSSAQEEWLARLLHDNPAAAAAPQFRTFFAGLGQSLRTALALRTLRDEARAGRLGADAEALAGGVAGWQPVRWSALRGGARAGWWAELFPPAPPAEPPLSRLARECSAALDAAGRLWSARGLSLSAFTSLASALTARTACTLALWQELAASGAG